LLVWSNNYAYSFIEQPQNASSYRIKALSRVSYAVDHFEQYEQALTRLETDLDAYDILLLDTSTTPHDMFTWCKTFRSLGYTRPIIVLSEHHDPTLASSLLLEHVDDFVRLPLLPVELIARIQAVSRRSTQTKDDTYTLGTLRLNTKTREAAVRGDPLSLSKKEILILELLMDRYPSTLSKEELTSHIWEVPDATASNTIHAHIKNIRKKLRGALDCEIVTVRSIGYRLRQQPTQDAPQSPRYDQGALKELLQ